ncbi:hypothetical protein XH97_10745 [Bradyrhizobium sp. CCBAU 53380]|nr:hypothetical protein [Bradyrhizobium sp. CCBAU 53380]
MRQFFDACDRTHETFNNVIFVVAKLALTVARKRCARLVGSASGRPCVPHGARRRDRKLIRSVLEIAATRK